MARIMRRRIPEIIQDLLTKPQKFSIHQALRILENQWLKTSLSESSLALKLLPAADLSFPVSDIRRSSIDSYGNISLELNFMGLYGVDSPLPLYFSQLAAQDTDDAKRIRKLLAIINHKIYIYHYLAWRQQNYFIRSEQGDKSYYHLMANLAGLPPNTLFLEAVDYAGLFLLKKRSAANLINLLSHYLNRAKVSVKKFMASEITMTEETQLGKKFFLKKNSFLGKKLSVANRYVGITIGPVTLQCAEQYFIELEPRQTLGKLIKLFIPMKMRFSLEVYYSLSPHYRAILGSQKLLLGWHAVLGRPQTGNYTTIISDASLLL